MSDSSKQRYPATLREWLWYRNFVIRQGWKRLGNERIPFWIARHLPRGVRYWTVVWAASKTKGNPAEVTAIQMLDSIDPPEQPRT